jgi:hypothetical protein
MLTHSSVGIRRKSSCRPARTLVRVNITKAYFMVPIHDMDRAVGFAT